MKTIKIVTTNLNFTTIERSTKVLRSRLNSGRQPEKHHGRQKQKYLYLWICDQLKSDFNARLQFSTRASAKKLFSCDCDNNRQLVMANMSFKISCHFGVSVFVAQLETFSKLTIVYSAAYTLKV